MAQFSVRAKFIITKVIAEICVYKAAKITGDLVCEHVVQLTADGRYNMKGLVQEKTWRLEVRLAKTTAKFLLFASKDSSLKGKSMPIILWLLF